MALPVILTYAETERNTIIGADVVGDAGDGVGAGAVVGDNHKGG